MSRYMNRTTAQRGHIALGRKVSSLSPVVTPFSTAHVRFETSAPQTPEEVSAKASVGSSVHISSAAKINETSLNNPMFFHLTPCF